VASGKLASKNVFLVFTFVSAFHKQLKATDLLQAFEKSVDWALLT